MNIPTLPENAPFSTEQRAWLNGYLASFLPSVMASSLGSGATSDTLVAEQEAGQNVTVAFGSQTGNSEGLAKKFAKKLKAAGHETKILDLADAELSSLEKEENLFFITSTYGDGEAPDNAQDFHAALMVSEVKLEKLNYSVLALGDSEYPDFCLCGKQIDARLAELGAKRLSPRIDCDVDFDDEFATWSELLLNELRQQV